MAESKEGEQYLNIEVIDLNSSSPFGDLSKIKLTLEEVKKRCVVYLHTVCIADMKPCDIDKHGRCHRYVPTIIKKGSDKIINK